MKWVEKLLETKLPTLLALGGIVLLAASFVNYAQTQSEWSVTLISPPHWVLFSSALGLLAGGVVLHWWDYLSGSWIARRKVINLRDGYAVKIGADDRETQIQVRFGKIEAFVIPASQGAMVLPANEFFDEECYEHSNTALGGFVHTHFSEGAFGEFIAAVESSKASSGLSTERVEKENNATQVSYKVGSCLFLDRPAKKDLRVILTAVSTKRAGEGIRSEATFLFSAVSRLHRLMADKRIDTIVLPILGAGKGGLKKGAALFTLVSAFTDASMRPAGHHLKTISIIVFQQPGSNPEIKRSSVRRILGVATAMFN